MTVSLHFIDTPEILPGSRIGPTPSSGGKSSNAGVIAGGIAGGVAAIAIVIVVIFYLRRSQAPPAMSAGVDASQSQQPLSDEVSSSGSPTTMRFYVRDFVSCVAIVCSHVSPSFNFRIPRTRVIQLRSQGTKVVRTRRTYLLKHICHRISGLEAP